MWLGSHVVVAVAQALIWPVAWEFSYAAGTAVKKKEKYICQIHTSCNTKSLHWCNPCTLMHQYWCSNCNKQSSMQDFKNSDYCVDAEGLYGNSVTADQFLCKLKNAQKNESCFFFFFKKDWLITTHPDDCLMFHYMWWPLGWVPHQGCPSQGMKGSNSPLSPSCTRLNCHP